MRTSSLMVLLHELRDRRGVGEILDEEDRRLRNEHPRRRGVQFLAAAHEPRLGRLCRVRGGRLLQVIDVLDLGVATDAVVVAAEVRLAVREEDRLVLATPECGDREVPPLREEERPEEDRKRKHAVTQRVPMNLQPTKCGTVRAREAFHRVGLADGRAVDGAAVMGGAVADGISPALNLRIAVATWPSGRRFSM